MEHRTRNRILAAVAGVLAVSLLAWGVSAYRAKARLARVQELSAQLTGEAAKTLSPEQRREQWKQLGQEMKQLAPDQRRAMEAERRKGFEASIDQYFQLPRKEQVKYLDAQINKMETMRKQWAAKSNSTKTGGSTTAGPRPGGGKGGSPEQRERRRKERLDASTPAERAKRAEFVKQMTARRQQRGLPALTFGPPR